MIALTHTFKSSLHFLDTPRILDDRGIRLNSARAVSTRACTILSFALVACIGGIVCAPGAHAQAAVTLPSPAMSSSAGGQSGVGVPGYPVNTVKAAKPAKPVPAHSIRPFSKVGIAVSFGTLGASADVAVPLSRSFNLRGGTDVMRFSTTLNNNGINYTPDLSYTTGYAGIDWFPFHGSFRISPGYMFYNGTNIGGTATALAYQQFSFGSDSYYSMAGDPLTGAVNVTWPQHAPRMTIGWGNMIPRTPGKHISFPAEFGFAYFGTGTSTLSFAGSVCQNQTGTVQSNCQKVNTDASFQTDVNKEHDRLQKNLYDYARFYPILKVGISYKF